MIKRIKNTKMTEQSPNRDKQIKLVLNTLDFLGFDKEKIAPKIQELSDEKLNNYADFLTGKMNDIKEEMKKQKSVMSELVNSTYKELENEETNTSDEEADNLLNSIN